MEFYTVQFFSVQYNGYFIVNESINEGDRHGGTETQINKTPVSCLWLEPAGLDSKCGVHDKCTAPSSFFIMIINLSSSYIM